MKKKIILLSVILLLLFLLCYPAEALAAARNGLKLWLETLLPTLLPFMILTVFVIAHRLSTVRNSKAIMVLEKGQIIERGSHDELIEQKGRYYQLYTGQFELE